MSKWNQSKERKNQPKPDYSHMNFTPRFEGFEILQNPFFQPKEDLDIAKEPLSTSKEGFKEGFKEGMDCAHIFQDIPGLSKIIFVLKNIFNYIQYGLEYIAIIIASVGSNDDITNDKEIIYNALYLTLILLCSFYFLFNWYYITIFCSNKPSVRSVLANGTVVNVSQDFFYDLFRVKKDSDGFGNNAIQLFNYFFIHSLGPVTFLYMFLFNMVPFVLNFLPNYAIFVLLNIFLLFMMIRYGTFMKNMYMAVFSQNTNDIGNDTMTLLMAIISISIAVNFKDFFISGIAKFGSAGTVGFVILFLAWLLQIVISLLLAKIAFFFIVAFTMFYSFFSIFAFAESLQTANKISKFCSWNNCMVEESVFDIFPDMKSVEPVEENK